MTSEINFDSGVLFLILISLCSGLMCDVDFADLLLHSLLFARLRK